MTESAKASSSYLTQEAYDRLHAELTHLTGPGRTEIAKLIEAAREEGDLKENGGYHAAKEEQGKMEDRIRQLDHLLRNSTVGAAPVQDGTVKPGSVVTVEMFGETEKFLLGSREILGDDEELDVYSEGSPLGSAILGQRLDQTVSYEAPNGKTVEVKILNSEAYTP